MNWYYRTSQKQAIIESGLIDDAKKKCIEVYKIYGLDKAIAMFGIAFVTWGASYVPAAEVSLLVLIESVLGPVWPWIFLVEAMSPTEVIGGLTILASVALFARVSAKPEAKRNAQNSAL